MRDGRCSNKLWDLACALIEDGVHHLLNRPEERGAAVDYIKQLVPRYIADIDDVCECHFSMAEDSVIRYVSNYRLKPK